MDVYIYIVFHVSVKDSLLKLNNQDEIFIEEEYFDIHIDENIKDTTIKCRKIFLCLSNNKEIYCKVKSFIDKDIDILKCLHNDYCNYKISFGNSKFCFCPTRKEIFKKYKI